MVVVVELQGKDAAFVAQLLLFSAVVNVERGFVKGVGAVVLNAADRNLAVSVGIKVKAEVFVFGV